MVADHVSSGGHPLYEGRVAGRAGAHHEEGGPGAVQFQQVEQAWRVRRVRTIVERQGRDTVLRQHAGDGAHERARQRLRSPEQTG
jgi:hypothetical protein